MIRINDSKSKTTLKAAVLVSVFLLFTAATGFGQQVVNLLAGPATTTMPDGTVLPMWGYSCQALAAGVSSSATCAPLSGAGSAAANGALGGIYVVSGGSGYSASTTVAINANQTTAPTTPATATVIVEGGVIVGINLTNPGAGYTAAPTIVINDGAGTGAAAAAGPAWSPVVITVPSGAAGGLTINLTNNLSFPTITGGLTNTVPTSIVIVGQVGGGLGTASTRTASPDHSLVQGCPTWFIADPNTPPGTPCTTNDSGAVPPTQSQGRVQSMATEVGAAAPGTGTATALTWAGLKPGTYLLESGTHPSIQAPMGLIGVVVVTTAPSGATAGTAYPAVGTAPAVTYNGEVPLEFSEIDPVQNKAVDLAVRTAGFSETAVWSGLPGGCATTHSCYPPAVNYTPFYYLINGVAFSKAAPAMSLFQVTAGVNGAAPVTTGISGTLLLRLVNAGLRMHVPSVVGSLTQGFSGSGAVATVGGFGLIAEDGNVVPGVAAPGKAFPSAPRVQTDVFMAAGKTFDVMVNVPAVGSSGNTPALPIYDRELSLSANSSVRDAGMLAYISVNNAVPTSALPVGAGSGVFGAAQANADTYDAGIPCVSGATSCTPVVVSDPSKGVIWNDVNVYGVALSSPPSNGTLTCNALPSNPVPGICANGTFTYTPNAGTAGTDSFGYCANGATPGTANLCTTVTLGASNLAGNPSAIAQTYTARTATYIKIPSPGLLLGNTDPSGLPLTVVTTGAAAPTVTGGTIVVDPQGGFSLSVPSNTTATSVNFSYTVQDSQGRTSATAGTVTVNFPAPSNLKVNVVDAQALANCAGNSTCIAGLALITDYRWIIEEDKTFYIDPNCTTNSSINTPGCPTPVASGGTIPTFGVQFHTSTLEFVAQGCTGQLSCEGGQTMLDNRPACTSTGVPVGCSATAGQHIPAVCDLGNGACRPDTTGTGLTAVMPGSAHLDPSKRYYISVLPGDAANPFPAYAGAPGCDPTTGAQGGVNPCGHTMSGAPIPAACNILGGPNGCTTSSAFTQPVTVATLPTPLPTGKLSVIVFEDDFPLNGEQDGGGGGGGTVAPIEPGLGGFNIVLWDTFGGLGDVTGQDSNDMFNQPLSNSLAGTTDPSTGLDACPLTPNPLQSTGPGGLISGNGAGPAPAVGMTGMIVTCPKYESDGVTLSPLAGQAVIANLMPTKFSVQAYPGADRIARGEQWLQTNTLDGQHPHDSFIRIGEPSYFQEYGPAGYHVAIGFANPAIINARHADVCAGAFGAVGPCTNTISGSVDVQRLSRTPDQRLYASGSRDALAWTQCWVSLGDPDSEDFMFTMCDANGNFKFTNVPGGNWRLTIGDQWNDQIIDGLSTPANVGCVPTPPATSCNGGVSNLNLLDIGVQQWQSNVYTRTFIDDNHDGIWEPNEIGIPLIYTRVRYRDGHNANALTTDFNGIAPFNETFPLFNWYVVEADSGRYKTTGIHTVYDAGGPADGSPSCGAAGARACGTSTAYNYLANTFEALPLPADLSVPGAVYCAKADCTAEAPSFQAGTAIPSPGTGGANKASTGRIDPPWVGSEGWSGMTSQGNWIDFGKAPFAPCPPACVNVSYKAPGAASATTTQAAENGGIHGVVDYASTRPFDDASQMIEQPWEAFVPHITINLYQENFAADGVTKTLTLVDTTKTSSWDDWAQGFYANSSAGSGAGAGQKPYMSCPGQGTGTTGTVNQDLFFFTLFDQPNYLDWYNSAHNGGTLHALPYNSQFKCYDAMHIWNQLQPATYDGKYSFPSVLGTNPTTGKLDTTLTGGVGTPGTAGFVAASMPGTNCTICVANPTTATKPAPGGDFVDFDPYRAGTPMLPPGKYVVEVIMPPGFEVYKEEDKNLLIGDNFIAPVTQQFGGLGADVFIIPDQASVASMYDQSGSGYNGSNYQNSTTGEGMSQTLSLPAYPGFQDPVWPCVGEMRVVPDFLSLFPQNQEVAPFAGATRPLCDRKEVTLPNQMSVSAKFYVFTSTHIASKYTGVITDDFTSEFDPFAPQFGEKFAPPNLAIATKDYLGNELSRVYSDHWGTYNGLTFSSWDVNPPNITGYSPSMMVQCMNDPGPIKDTTPGSPTFGQMITDPLYNPAYSVFCYEEPYMPGLTTYLDTPVVPTQAFVGAGYNNPDCAYPDTTPAIKEVDGDGIGPWVSRTGSRKITITALGDVQVNNSAYSGPSANVAPFNQKTIKRHYGFGGTAGTATVGGVALTGVTWSDGTITGTVPLTVPSCTVQQQTQYGGPGKSGTPALCGQLLITTANGKQSVDTVTVTVGGSAPKHVSASSTIQSAIDGANPGDLIIVDPNCTTTTSATTGGACEGAVAGTNVGRILSTAVAAHSEMLLMWKPVRLQGVGAASSVIDANANPAGKLLNPWRRHVNCLFGLSLSGSPSTSTSGAGSYDPTGAYNCPDAGWANFKGAPNAPQVDRLPLEAVVGWDATVNGNLAEQLQEPSLMGAYEGAGITVLGKGVLVPAGQSPWTDGSEPGAFPIGTLLLQDVAETVDSTGAPVGPQFDFCNVIRRNRVTNQELVPNPYPSNFECNPSSIDGLSVTDSSQGGGGIFVHGWAHNLQIGNNRVYNNAGTLSGGISVGQGEFPVAITTVATGTFPPVGQSVLDAPPSCQMSNVVGTHLPYCLDNNVNVHNNYVTNNSSLGDELFSGTLSGGGGVSFCTGSDFYKFQYNWVCGNLSSGEGGGLVHLGFIYNGDIEHNSILYNQSDNPTIPTNGGGIQIQGTPDTDPVCGTQPDADCPPGLSDGTGPNLVINANLIQGNMAESGSGGGIRLQQLNGTEVSTFPKSPSNWNSASITNNIIVNNVAGWDGGGISLQDSLNVSITNNTIASNDTLASSGVLTQSIGTPIASAPAGNCVQPGPTGPTSASCPQSAGVTSTQNSTLLTTSFTGLTLTCPVGTTSCQGFSNPVLQNNVIWQNRSFYIGVGNLGQGTLNQQKLVSLFDAFTGTAAPVQIAAGQCTSGVSYWDIGVRGDTGPSNHGSGFRLAPTYSVLDDVADYPGAHNLGSNPAFTSQYCNGSRVPPTCTAADGCGGPSGYGVPPGIVDASAPNPIFSLTPSATVDEGNNWINVSWGPLDTSDPSVLGADGNYGGGPLFANYALAASSPANNAIPVSQPHPTLDFFGNPRPDPSNTSCFDVGAVEFQGGAGGPCASGGGGGGNIALTPATWTPTATRGVGAGFLCFGINVGPCQTFTLTNNTGARVTGVGNGVLSGTNASDYTIVRALSSCGPAGGGQIFGITALNNGQSCVVTVQFLPKSTDTAGAKSATISVTDSAGTQSATITGTAR